MHHSKCKTNLVRTLAAYLTMYLAVQPDSPELAEAAAKEERAGATAVGLEEGSRVLWSVGGRGSTGDDQERESFLRFAVTGWCICFSPAQPRQKSLLCLP